MSLHHPILFYLGFMFAILYSMTSSAYGANVVSLDTKAGYAGTEVVVALSIDNDSTLAGLQFTIRDSPDVLILKSVSKISRSSAFSTPDFNDLDGLGVAKIIAFTLGAPMAIGSGDVLLLTFEIPADAPSGDISFAFDQIDFRAKLMDQSDTNLADQTQLEQVIVSLAVNARDANEFPFLPKPFTPDNLLKLARSALDKPQFNPSDSKKLVLCRRIKSTKETS